LGLKLLSCDELPEKLRIVGLTNKLIIKIYIASFGNLYSLSYQLLNKQGLGAGIDSDMALTPFPSSFFWIQTHDLPNVS